MGYIPTVRFRDDNLNTIIAGLEMDQVKSVVYEKFIPNIEQAINKNKKNVIFCYTNNEYQVIINENDYYNTLDIIEKYYVIKENFEVCAKIKKLKDVIKERRS
jgi:hypothetical protein